jgi:hypothetical protein
MRSAAALLSSTRSFDGLADLARAAGIGGEAVDVDRDSRAALGIDDVPGVRIAAGPGAIRLLLLELGTPEPLRDSLHRIARRVASRAPHVLWMALAIDDRATQAALVAWPPGPSPRVSSFVWEPARVTDSDAETLCALAAVSDVDDELRHHRCLDVLGRDALTRRFYRALEAQVAALAGSVSARADVDPRQIALLYVSRLLFLRFLEAKGWLNAEREFISTRFDHCMRAGGGFHRRVLLPLFFGTLNTPPSRRARAARAFGAVPFLNGGLFTRTPIERRAGAFAFSDEQLGAMLEQLFARFRFVAREDSATWSEASVDPEMLGRAFESLMASGERRTGGVYYTPHELVARVTEPALATAFATSGRQVRELRVLDPACGSGAFLVYALERLAGRRRELGDERDLSTIRREVLARSVFGVDRSPTAVWLCELRLWLSVVIESNEGDPLRIPPLPNLDRNIRVGDALTGAGFAPGVIVGSRRVADLRIRYMRATGSRKQVLARTLDRAERARVLAQTEREIEVARHARRERLTAQRAVDLFGERTPSTPASRRELAHLKDRLRALRNERRRIQDGGALPFSFGAFFADAQAHGGFDVVVGNPPWVRVHRIPAALRLQFRRTYEVFRAPPWSAGNTRAGAAPGFATQVDLAALFVERSVALLRDGGTLSLLLPVKLWKSLAGSGLRQFVTRATQPLRLEDFSDSRHAFDAAVYPSLLVAAKGSSMQRLLVMAIHDRRATREWRIEPSSLSLDGTAGAPWLMLTPDARIAFERVRAAGPSLSTVFGPPRLGVKSGCNAAFLLKVIDRRNGLASVVDADGECGSVESELLRPALRGDTVVAWACGECREWILWTHDASGAPVAQLPERARRWLHRRYGALAARTDVARARRWWALFRVDAADYATSRLVWADFGRRPQALVLPAGDRTVPLNTCYALRCPDERDAWALAAILNSVLGAAWLNAVAEPARGGYRRYMSWTVGLLPVPHDWARARDILADARGLDDERLLQVVLAAFRLRRAHVSALIEAP